MVIQRRMKRHVISSAIGPRIHLILSSTGLLFLEKFFTIVRREIMEKLLTQADTPLPVLWYNYLLQDGKKNRQRIYNEIVTMTEDSMGAERTPHYSTASSSEVKQDQPVYIAAKALIDTIKNRTKEDESEEKPRPIRLLVYIDEAHEMTTQQQTIQYPHLVSEGEHTMDNVCLLAFMVRFGRPLWWTRWEAGNLEVWVNLLERKQQYHPESYLAALSVPLMLDFEPRRRHAIENEDLMVAGHLRVANVIPSHREHIISSTLSEPIVAEAATQILQGQNMLDLLHDNVSYGFIEKGKRGELAARLLLMLAHDAALSKLDIKRDRYQGQIERLYTTPVPLLTFISALLAESYIEHIMKA